MVILFKQQQQRNFQFIYILVEYECPNSAANVCIEINGTHFISNIQHYVCSVVDTISNRAQYSKK